MLNSCNKEQTSWPLGYYDYHYFNGTIALELAKAVQANDSAKVKSEILINNVPVDYKPERNGITPLMLAAFQNKLLAAKSLLESGANPNLYSNEYIGGSERFNAVLMASRYFTASPEMLKLLLEYNGNPNSQERGTTTGMSGNLEPAWEFALYLAATHSLEKVKLLVEAGADVNKKAHDSNGTALMSALKNQRFDIVLYLLENGADFKKTYRIKRQDLPEEIYYTGDLSVMLRMYVYPIGSEMHQQKMAVVDFLKEHNIDYFNVPIPEWIERWAKEKYPNNWEYFLEKY